MKTHMFQEVGEIPAAAARFLDQSAAEVRAAAAAMRRWIPTFWSRWRAGRQTTPPPILNTRLNCLPGCRLPRSAPRSPRSTTGRCDSRDLSASVFHSPAKARILSR